LAGQYNELSNEAAWLVGTAVSLPPLSQPQQSARTREHWVSLVHSAPTSAAPAQAQVKQPFSSVAKPASHVIDGSHATGEHTSLQ
jgi:hypothetical protein